MMDIKDIAESRGIYLELLENEMLWELAQRYLPQKRYDYYSSERTKINNGALEAIGNLDD